MALTSRVAIIAGGLGGLGSAIGKLLHSQGAKLALLYAPFEAQNVPEALNAYGPNASEDIKTYECDITSAESVEKAFKAIEDDGVAFPSILINTAGYVNLQPFEELEPEDALKHYMINLYGPTLTSRAFARLYFKHTASQDSPAPGGRIVNIASQAAHVALQNHGAYCASKAGLIGLTRCMASEWGGRGITANTISPGPVMTALGKKAWGDKDVREKYLAEVPTGDFAEPDEVAHIVQFLCQDAAKNINGDDIRLDGGYTAR